MNFVWQTCKDLGLKYIDIKGSTGNTTRKPEMPKEKEDIYNKCI